jgi:hypothetical protein
MTGEATAKVREIPLAPAEDGKRRGRKPAGERNHDVIARFFLGESTDGKVHLAVECRSEAEAQLASLRQEKPYFRVEAWQAVADLSQGSVAVHKKAVNKT